MQVVVPILLAATVFAVTNWLKQITAKDWNAVITQIIVWGVGCIGVWAAAQTTLFGDWAPFSVPLKLLKTADLIFIGLNIGSFGTGFNEFKKAKDETDSARTPHLLPRLARHPVHTPPKKVA